MNLTNDEATRQELDLCSRDFWYFAQFLQTEDEERQIIRPYPLEFPHLHRLDYELMQYQKVAALKSRRMQVSMHLLARLLHAAKFAGTNLTLAPQVFYGGYSATDQDLAEYQISRVIAMHQSLPPWLRDYNPLVKDNMLYLQFERGGKIKGFPLKREGPQGFGFSWFVFDEMAWQEAAAKTLKGLMPTIGVGKVTIVSTPNGMEGTGRPFYEIFEDPNHIYRDIHRIKIHWRENPEHDDAWFARVTSGLKQWEILQMYELSFISYAGTPVWPRFERRTHATPTQVIPGRPVYLHWDFGYHHPGFLICQKNGHDQWQICRELLGHQEGFDIFCANAKELAEATYEREKTPEIHFIDPDGLKRYRTRARSGAASDAHQIKITWSKNGSGHDVQVRPGMMVTGSRSNEEPRMKLVRKLWELRSDGRPGVIVDPSCTNFIDGCESGYCYDQKEGEVPMDNIYSHLQSAFQFGISGYEIMHHPDKNPKKTGDDYDPEWDLRRDHNRKQNEMGNKLGIIT